MPSKSNILGQVFHRLTVLEESSERLSNLVTWKCKCECGNVVKVISASLKNGNTKSCGCLSKENARKIGFKNRKEAGFNGLNSLFRSYISNAKKRGIDFDLDFDLFSFYTQLPCYFCSSLPSQVRQPTSRTEEGKKHSKYLYNGIDRVDSNKGYSANNILPCCKNCNYAKGTQSILEFKKMISKIYRNLNSYEVLK